MTEVAASSNRDSVQETFCGLFGPSKVSKRTGYWMILAPRFLNVYSLAPQHFLKVSASDKLPMAQSNILGVQLYPLQVLPVQHTKTLWAFLLRRESVVRFCTVTQNSILSRFNMHHSWKFLLRKKLLETILSIAKKERLVMFPNIIVSKGLPRCSRNFPKLQQPPSFPNHAHATRFEFFALSSHSHHQKPQK